jgi:hypothetical protein
MAVGGRLGWGFTGAMAIDGSGVLGGTAPVAVDGSETLGFTWPLAVGCIRGGLDANPMGSSGTLLPPYPERLGGGGIPQLGFKTALAAVRSLRRQSVRGLH